MIELVLTCTINQDIAIAISIYIDKIINIIDILFMRTYVYAYIYIYTRTHMRIYIYIYVHVHARALQLQPEKYI